jgi:hypothetical protein
MLRRNGMEDVVTDVQRRESVRMRTVVRGEVAEVCWIDGVLSGDASLVERMNSEAHSTSTDLRDAAAAAACLEHVVGTRPDIELLD